MLYTYLYIYMTFILRHLCAFIVYLCAALYTLLCAVSDLSTTLVTFSALSKYFFMFQKLSSDFEIDRETELATY